MRYLNGDRNEEYRLNNMRRSNMKPTRDTRTPIHKAEQSYQETTIKAKFNGESRTMSSDKAREMGGYCDILMEVLSMFDLKWRNVTDFGFLLSRGFLLNRVSWKSVQTGSFTVGYWTDNAVAVLSANGYEKKQIKIVIKHWDQIQSNCDLRDFKSHDVGILGNGAKLGDTWYTKYDKSELFLCQLECSRHRVIMDAYHVIKWLGKSDWDALLSMLPDETLAHIKYASVHARTTNDKKVLLSGIDNLRKSLSEFERHILEDTDQTVEVKNSDEPEIPTDFTGAL